jgi:predicted metal-dependent peptidase
MQQGIVLPGVIKGETISVVVAIDASGSISQADATDFLTEIDGIVSQYDDYNIRVWSFDTQVYNDQTFSLESGENISEYQIKGGGGTSFDVNWMYMKENGIEPKIFVMFTDGYTGDGWGDADYCESIFIVKHNQSAVAPHGITVTYEEL